MMETEEMKDPKSSVYRNLIGRMLEMMDQPSSKGEESQAEEVQEEEKEDIEENHEDVGGMNDVLKASLKDFMQPKRKKGITVMKFGVSKLNQKNPKMGKK